VHPLRFRGNLRVEGWPAWHEFDLLNQEIAIGPSARLKVVKRIVRCAATEVGPDTSHSRRTPCRNNAPSRTLGYDVNQPGAHHARSHYAIGLSHRLGIWHEWRLSGTKGSRQAGHRFAIARQHHRHLVALRRRRSARSEQPALLPTRPEEEGWQRKCLQLLNPFLQVEQKSPAAEPGFFSFATFACCWRGVISRYCAGQKVPSGKQSQSVNGRVSHFR